MDVRVLTEAFADEAKEVSTIPSWDDVDGLLDAGMHDTEQSMGKEQAEELMQQFAALGYIDDPGEDKEIQHRNTDIECKYNLSRNLMWQGKNDQAMKLLEEFLRLAKWETRFVAQLADSYLRCGYARQALRLLTASFDIDCTRVIQVKIVFAKALLKPGRNQEAMAGLAALEALSLENPGVCRRGSASQR